MRPMLRPTVLAHSMQYLGLEERALTRMPSKTLHLALGMDASGQTVKRVIEVKPWNGLRQMDDEVAEKPESWEDCGDGVEGNGLGFEEEVVAEKACYFAGEVEDFGTADGGDGG